MPIIWVDGGGNLVICVCVLSPAYSSSIIPVPYLHARELPWRRPAHHSLGWRWPAHHSGRGAAHHPGGRTTHHARGRTAGEGWRTTGRRHALPKASRLGVFSTATSHAPDQNCICVTHRSRRHPTWWRSTTGKGLRIRRMVMRTRSGKGH